MSEFSVTFLGTGSAMPDGERAQTGLLLDGRNESVLVDCGSGVLSNLARTDPGYEGIATLVLTHHHVDHVADLMALCKARWLAGSEELEIVGPDGTETLVEGLFGIHEYLQDRLDITVREVGPGDVAVPGFDVRATETRHSMDCLAYRFEPAGTTNRSEGEDGHRGGDSEDTSTSFTFSGDSEAFSDLVEFADGGTLAHDCSFPDAVDVANHPTPTQLGEALAAADADVKRVYLTHLYPHTRGHHGEMVESIEAHYDGEVRFARDGLEIEIG